MTIVPMERVSLIGLHADREAVLDALQALGVVHLVPLRAADPLATREPDDRRKAEAAFRHAMDAPERLRAYPLDRDFDLDAVIAEITANRIRLRTLADRRDLLDARIEALAPWGDFALPPAEETAGQRLWLYALPLRDRAALDRLDLPWAIVGREPAVLHVALIAPEAPPADVLPVPRLDWDGTPLTMLVREREALEIDLEKAERERADLTRWRVLLGRHLATAQDADDRRAAAERTLQHEAVFAVQGWAPADAGPALEALAARHGIALLRETPTADDHPPTLLRPRADRFAIGADLTSFYTSPGYRDWDPSLIVFASFAVFFAMIIADAGYAALFGLLTALWWARMGASATGRRARVLLAALSGTAFAYGVAAGSYFSFAPPEGGILARLAVIDVGDFDAMMRVSVLIGALHIAIGLGVVAWLNRGTGRATASLGWIAVLAGGLLLWLGDGAAARMLASAGLVSGLAAVFWGNGSERAIEKPVDWLWRLADGLLGLTSATKLFGDLLSYLRLFALGLASASLGATFNALAMDLAASRPGTGVLLAILVLVFGHGINILIGIMGGVVHGLRLNYVEFFGWGLTEEGYPFRAFAKRELPA